MPHDTFTNPDGSTTTVDTWVKVTAKRDFNLGGEPVDVFLGHYGSGGLEWVVTTQGGAVYAFSDLGMAKRHARDLWTPEVSTIAFTEIKTTKTTKIERTPLGGLED